MTPRAYTDYAITPFNVKWKYEILALVAFLRLYRCTVLGHFTFLICRGRQRDVKRFTPHVTAVNLPINLLFGNVLVAVVVVVCLSCLMSYGRLPFQWTSWDRNVLRQIKYLMSVIMCPQKQFTLRYFANALRGELNTAACRLSFEDHLPI